MQSGHYQQREEGQEQPARQDVHLGRFQLPWRCPVLSPSPLSGKTFVTSWIKLQMCCVRFSCHVRLSPETARSLALWRLAGYIGCGAAAREWFRASAPHLGSPAAIGHRRDM